MVLSKNIAVTVSYIIEIHIDLLQMVTRSTYCEVHTNRSIAICCEEHSSAIWTTFVGKKLTGMELMVSQHCTDDLRRLI